MRRLTSASLVLGALIVSLLAVAPADAAEPRFARMETEAGDILLVFYPELAPNHVANFVHLAQAGFYDGTKFHRIVPGFVIQGGDPNSKDDDPRNDGMGGPSISDVLSSEEAAALEKLNTSLESRGYQSLSAGQANLKAEFSQTAKHVRGSLSMARSQNVDSAGSQFFVCVDDTPMLDGKYTIFGHVVMGMDVADTIVNAEKNPAAGRDAPAKPVAIKHVAIIDGTAGLTAEEQAAWQELPADLKTAR